MRKEKILKSLSIHLLSLIIILTGFLGTKMDAHAADIPNISLTFDSSDQSVIVEGIPAYVTAIYSNGTGMVEEDGPKQTITITLTKKDESTNWGPGLPNTTVESYDLCL